MLLNDLYKKQLITPPKWLLSNTHYLTMMGSVAYGVSTDMSDVDLYGFCIPPKELVFPHLAGEIEGFGEQTQRFKQFQQHHIKDKSADRVYDVTVYSIVKYFQLCMENNPNMIDSLFTPANCVVQSTKIANMVREHRHMFLHKGAWYSFKGYAYSQLHKARSKTPFGYKELVDFEKKHDLSNKTSLLDITTEMEKRGLVN